ncbi:free fatty acid receptor 2 [Amia ocellicauda]|uniref:free fatty acid receptor 2 n=1 Tax=Amia ocellicauda TaxID=2972642 RepID=UPI0034646409
MASNGNNEHHRFLGYLSVVIFTLTFVLGLPSNLLVVATFFKKARNKGATPNVVYVINSCLANLFFILWLPVKVTETLNNWMLPPVLCPVYNFFQFGTIYASILFLTAISVGRYLSIAFPITYKLYKNAKNSCLVCAFLWTLVTLHVALVLIIEGNGGQLFVSSSLNNISTCYENFTEAQLNFLVPLRLEMSVAMFFLPLLITTFCYFSCMALVVRSCLQERRKRRVIVVALSTLLIFVVCFGPYNVSHVVGYIQHENIWWRRVALLTSNCNVFLEPMVIIFLSSPPMHSLNLCWQTVKRKLSNLKCNASACRRRQG